MKVGKWLVFIIFVLYYSDSQGCGLMLTFTVMSAVGC